MRGDAPRTQYAGWRRWWPLGLLCVLKGTRWMFSEAWAGSGSTLTTELLGCGSAGLLCFWISRKAPRLPLGRAEVLRPLVGGALLIAGPLVALFAPAAALTGASIAMALALTPVVLAVIDSAAQHSGDDLAGRLWPGLAAIAGMLLLLSQPSLANPWADVLLLAIPVVTAAGAALFCSAKETSLRMPLALGGATVVFALGVLASMLSGQGVPWSDLRGVGTGLDALEATVCVLALGRVSAARWSSQFVLVPLLILLEGALMSGTAVAGRVVGGLLLLAAAGVALLVPPSEDSGLSLGVPRAEPRRSE